MANNLHTYMDLGPYYTLLDESPPLIKHLVRNTIPAKTIFRRSC